MTRKFRHLIRVTAWLLIAFLLTQCAQISNPSGGPKDTDPPKVLTSSPPNGSANFRENKFTISFDEFIELDNINQKALISPPTDDLPDFKLKGKSLQVKFNEELKENTTYSIYFGDAIVDLTESNPLLNYTYIFSTGKAVDSMSITGEVLNAFDLTPVEEVFVLLYKDNNDTLPLDSLPLNVKPYYLSKTNVNGQFQLSGLSDEPYLMFAIKDLNNNYFYDQPGEEIAFLDSLVFPQYLERPQLDSSFFDSLELESPFYDSLRALADTAYLKKLKEFDQNIINNVLYLFDEVDTSMQLLEAETIRKNVFRFSFSRPARDVDFQVMNYLSDTTWYLQEFSREEDTIIWFLRDLPVDTVEVNILYGADTLSTEYLRLDPQRRLPGSERRRKKDQEKKEYLTFKRKLRGNILRLDDVPDFVFSQPVATVLSDSIMLVSGEDTTYNPEYQFLDSLHTILQYPISVTEDTRYEFYFPDSVFIDWNGLHNEQKNFRLNTRTLRDYGVLSLSVRPEVIQPYIFQLMTEKEEIVREHYFNGDTTLRLEYLDPGTYVLKVIFDNNGNQKWDPGNYNLKRQPEKVTYYSKKAMIRGNWELEEEWEIVK